MNTNENLGPTSGPKNSVLGFQFLENGEKKNTRTDTNPSRGSPPATALAIRPEDFQDVGRALELFRQAIKCGLVPNDSEHARLFWMAAIEPSPHRAGRKPCRACSCSW